MRTRSLSLTLRYLSFGRVFAFILNHSFAHVFNFHSVRRKGNARLLSMGRGRARNGMSFVFDAATACAVAAASPALKQPLSSIAALRERSKGIGKVAFYNYRNGQFAFGFIEISRPYSSDTSRGWRRWWGWRRRTFLLSMTMRCYFEGKCDWRKGEISGKGRLGESLEGAMKIKADIITKWDSKNVWFVLRWLYHCTMYHLRWYWGWEPRNTFDRFQ